MPKTKIKVIVDTNWWVSFAMKPAHSQMLEILLDNDIELVASMELENEIFSVLQRPELARYFPPDALQVMRKTFKNAVVKYVVTSKIEACRDSKDDFLLALCRDAKADILITGDKDLLSMEKFDETEIMGMSQFLKA